MDEVIEVMSSFNDLSCGFEGMEWWTRIHDINAYNFPKCMEGMRDMGLKQKEMRKEQVPRQMGEIKDLYQVYKDPKWMESVGYCDKGYTKPKMEGRKDVVG